MSNQKKIDEEELLRQFEEMLGEGGVDFSSDEEEDFGFYYPSSSAGFHPPRFSGYDEEEDEPPPVPKETKRVNRFCRHENKIKKYLITSYYYYCPDCKNEVE